MQINFLVFITFSIVAIGCNNNEDFNDEKDLCFIDMSVVNDEIAFPHTPISVCKMTDSMPWIWSLSFFGDNGNCKHFNYHKSIYSRNFSYNEDSILPWRNYYDSSLPQTGLALIIDTKQSYGIPANQYYLQGNLDIDKDFYKTISKKSSKKYPTVSTVAFYIVNRQPYGIPIPMSSYIPILIPLSSLKTAVKNRKGRCM